MASASSSPLVSAISAYETNGLMDVLRSTGMCTPPKSSVSGFQDAPLSMRMASMPEARASSVSAPSDTDLPLPVSATTRPWWGGGQLLVEQVEPERVPRGREHQARGPRAPSP